METTGNRRHNDIHTLFLESSKEQFFCVCVQQSVFLKGKATVGDHVKVSLIQRTCGSVSDRMLQAK